MESNRGIWGDIAKKLQSLNIIHTNPDSSQHYKPSYNFENTSQSLTNLNKVLAATKDRLLAQSSISKGHCNSRSKFQRQRIKYYPKIPEVLKHENFNIDYVDYADLSSDNIAKHLPYISSIKPFNIVNFDNRQPRDSSIFTNSEKTNINIGVLLSGGPAPGGHNVIFGIYETAKKLYNSVNLYGFLGGIDGLLKKKYILITDSLINKYKNLGGFHMLCSGRGKVNSNKDLENIIMVNILKSLRSLINYN